MGVRLKPFRVVFSLLVLGTLVFLFLDAWTGLSVKAGNYFIDFQLVPSLVRTLVTHTLVAGGFVLIFLLSLLFGRVYCSFLCPLGTMIDLVIWLKRRIRGRSWRMHGYVPPYRAFRYLLFAVIAASLFTGSMTLLLLFDPYSLAGRITTNLVSPLFTLAFNGFVDGLHAMNNFSVAPLDRIFRFSPAFWLTLGWLTLILSLTLWKGRVYCNTLCPAGTLLGLVSLASLYRVRFDPERCSGCGLCEAVCKAGCIDPIRQKTDVTRCVGCQNCTRICPEGAIGYRPVRLSLPSVTRPVDAGRRKAIRNLPFLLALPAVKAISPPDPDGIATTGFLPVRKMITPPGSLGRAHFTAHCTACYRCVGQCPTQVLQPFGRDCSIEGMLQPSLDLRVKYCLYECNICSLICPTGAILPQTVAEKKRIQTGRARFIEQLCIVITKGTHCGACSEHCPTKACNMIPYTGNLTLPVVNPEICVGCGACEHVCPTSPKSIVVDENIIHLTAAEPVSPAAEPLKTIENSDENDFPF